MRATEASLAKIDFLIREAEEAEATGWQYPDAINGDEWTKARTTPDCIVENYLFADVALLIAPGGTGKTTLVLYEAIHIVLGLCLWGLKIKRPGPVLILTAEDTREMLIARLRNIAEDMGLSDNQIATVRAHVRISDLSGGGAKLTCVVGDVVLPNHLVEEVIHASRDNPPVLVVIDPAVSFGVGESRVNDAEQGLIEAARKIRRALNCCVRYVHHTGKANAREKSLDQYAGRNGSAFADGARMVAVMQGSYTQGDWLKLTGYQLSPTQSPIVMALPKLSYCSPRLPVYIVRDGFRFEHITSLDQNVEADLHATANQVWQLIVEELKSKRYYTSNSIDALSKTANLTRQEMRDAVKVLTAAGRLEKRERPDSIGKKGGAYAYLHPVELSAETAIAPPNENGGPIEKLALCPAV